MQTTHNNAEASAVEVVRALKSIERISRPMKQGICNVEAIDLLKTINAIAQRVLRNEQESAK
jgi:uncharacterized protein YoaH (UPF0181 family)